MRELALRTIDVRRAFFRELSVRDPALGTDELTTAISDNLSMLLYFIVAIMILF